MSDLMIFIGRYAVPLFFFMVSLFILIGDPSEQLSTRMPIVPGRYQFELALGSAIIGAVLAYLLRRSYAKRREVN